MIASKYHCPVNVHAKTEVLDFNGPNVRLVLTDLHGTQELHMHGKSARFIVEAIAAANHALAQAGA